MVRKFAALLMVVALAGCGDDTHPAGSGGTSGSGGSGGSGGMSGSGGSGGSGGMMIDAPTDGAMMTGGRPGDGQMGVTCMDYCDCMLSSAHCLGSPGGYAQNQRNLCLSNCGMFTQTQLDCRTMHCNFADNNQSVHCLHAIGMGTGVPPACQ